MSAIAIITARGGSKRIPRKNIKEFCGRPIIAYSIDAALKSGIFDEVMVSTDDKDIAEISLGYGASVPFFRSEQTSNDYATTRDVLLEVFEAYETRGKTFDYACCIYPTAPFVDAEKLCKAMNLLLEKKATQVMPIVRFSFPPQRAHIMDEYGQIRYRFEKYRDVRSQDLEPFYHDAGQFYCLDVNKYIKGIDSDKVFPLIIAESEVQDIDTLEDWKIAEMKYRIMKNKI